MIETIQLFPGVTLYCFRDSRFKQGCLSIQLLRPMVHEEAAMNALLPSVLLRGTRSAPDLRQITRRLDDLYGASISPLVRRVGDYQTTGFYISMIDDRFALPGETVLADTMAFAGELLLDSPLSGDGFLPEFVESEKKNQISAIETELNDKRVYAMQRLFEILCKGDSYGVPRMGDTAHTRAITPQKLYSHYKTILSQSPVCLFYVGSQDPDRVARSLLPVFSAIARDYRPLPPQCRFQGGPGSDVTETLDVTQGKLCLGYTTPITNRDPEFYAMQVFNALFGGGMTSKLFQNVREKQSLCYSVGSGYYAAKGLLLVSAGIDFDKEAQTRQEVERQLEACRRGDITDAELTAARQALISTLQGVHDSPSSIEGYYSSMVLSGIDRTPEAYRQGIEQVTAAQVTEAARSVTAHSSYFLKGETQ